LGLEDSIPGLLEEDSGRISGWEGDYSKVFRLARIGSYWLGKKGVIIQLGIVWEAWIGIG